MRRRLIFTAGISLVLCILAGFASISARAQEPQGPAADRFDYAWEVQFREKQIGYSLSRFCFITDGDEQRLTANGYRSFDFEIGPVSLRIIEQTRAVWDDRGYVLELDARTAVGGNITITHVLRTSDGISVIKETDKKEKEYFFAKDEYDHTELDRFLHTLDDPDGETTFRILSITDEKVKDISYEFLGVTDFLVSEKKMVCSRVGFDGPKSTGEMLVDDLGIPVFFSMETPLGLFVFVPCDPASAEDMLFSGEAGFFDNP